MRELLSLATVKALFVITGVVAACCIAVASVVLVFTVRSQDRTIRDQDRELDCRAEDAAQLDVIRSEITLELSVGLVAVVQEDEVLLEGTVQRISDLQVDLEEATERRERSVARCQR